MVNQKHDLSLARRLRHFWMSLRPVEGWQVQHEPQEKTGEDEIIGDAVDEHDGKDGHGEEESRRKLVVSVAGGRAEMYIGGRSEGPVQNPVQAQMEDK